MRNAAATARKADQLHRKRIDEAYAVAEWLRGLRESNNDTFLPLFFDKHRFLVLKGGGGSGKSVCAARKVIERAYSEPGHRFLVCRKVARTLRESCFRLITALITQYYPQGCAKIYSGDMRIVFKSGSEIIFAGLDDVEKLKSIYEITDVWVEEATEISRDDYSQLKIRMRGKSPYYRQMILTFNPISIMHWLKAEFFDRDSAKVKTHESTYLDNRFLTKEDRETLEDFRETDEYYYSVYCLGMWGVTGKTVFDAKKLSARYQALRAPACMGLFDIDYAAEQIGKYAFREIVEGGKNTEAIKIYKRPEKGVPYVIGADTAGEGSDKFIACVLDNRTGEQVAVYRKSTDEDLFAHQLYCLGRWYNDALIGVETNFSTYVVRELQRLNYPKQYVRERMDDYMQTPQQSFGFRTDTKTRPVLVAGLVRLVRDNVELINDATTIEEMLTFVRDENYKPCAEPGAHDDCVMALGIAHMIRPYQDVFAEPDAEAVVEWHESQWDDYYRASPEARAELIRRWGNPGIKR